ncbi:MAG: glycosyltransferase family 39 protein [Cyanobacteria bacterium P01_F01_bin.116]
MNNQPSPRHWLSMAYLLLGSLLLGVLIFSTWVRPPMPAIPVTWSQNARWLTTPEPSYRIYARHRVNLPGVPKAAWLRLSADNDYTLYVNGQIIAQEVSTPRNTAGLATKRSEPYQGLNDSTSYRWLIPDWLQISHSQDWKITTYVDLTQHLKKGENIIAIEAQDSTPTARVVIEGEIYPTNADHALSITTGEAAWRISPKRQYKQQFFWFEPNFSDYSWLESRGTAPIKETTYSRVDKKLFQKPLQGNWITAKKSERREVWLKGQWVLPAQYQHAVIRFAGDERYGVTINGHLINQYSRGDGNQLHLYDVTKLLHPGINTISVRLTDFWSQDWSRQQNKILNPNGILRFYLDGWTEISPGQLSTVSTNESWQSFTVNKAQNLQGNGSPSPVLILAPPTPSDFYRTYEGDAYLLDYPDLLYRLACFIGLTTAVVCMGSWALGLLVQSTSGTQYTALELGSTLTLPTSLFLICVGLLKHRYAEAEVGIWFAQSSADFIIFTTAILVTLLACLGIWWRCRKSRYYWLLWGGCGCAVWIILGLMISHAFWWLGCIFIAGTLFTNRLIRNTFTGLQKIFWQIQCNVDTLRPAYQRSLLGIVLIISLILRLYKLGFDNPEPDENVSWDATRGILRTGAPLESSGVWYTRSPVYHYLLAIWLRILGNSLFNARLFSVLIGIATLVLIFYFTHYLTKNFWLALFVTAILTIDPWELWYSRNIRFYQMAQLFCIAAFWAFIEGFINRRNRHCQHLFFIFITLTLLSQEVTLLVLPGFLIAFLFYYKPFKLSEDWSILFGGFMCMLIFAFNIYFVKIKSLTPLVGLSSYTTSFIKLQFNDMSIFATNFFVGVNRMYTIYSVFFIVSFIYSLFSRDRKIIALFIGIWVNIGVITVMVFLKAARYTYPTYPIFIILALHGTFLLAGDVGTYLNKHFPKGINWKPVFIAAIAILLLLNIEPIRVLHSYDESLRPRHMDISRYIQSHRKPGDVVISNVPAGHANTFGGADYYLMHRMSFFDAVYKHNGRVIDRWEGGVLLTNFDKLASILENSERVWIHMFDRQLPKDPELARFFNILQSVGEPVIDTYGAQLRLWQKEDGYLIRMPNRGGDFGAY